MKIRPLIVLIFTSLLSIAGPARAVPITFDFSFHDAFYGNDVTGYILGLEDNGLSQAATSVVVTSSSLGYGIGEYIGNPLYNEWDVVNGIIGIAEKPMFGSEGAFNTAPAVTCCALAFVKFGQTVMGGLWSDPSIGALNGWSPVTFTPRENTVPLPQTLALLVVGLAALAANRRKHWPT